MGWSFLEFRKRRVQEVACTLHLDVGFAKRDDKLQLERDFEIVADFSVSDGKFQCVTAAKGQKRA